MSGLPAVLMILAQATTADASHPAYGPAAPPAPAAAAAKTAERDCAAQPRPANANEIVVCAVKPNGYRLPSDVVEAKRLKKQQDAGRPRNPHETYAAHNCATGPAGCQYGGVDLVGAALTAAEMAKRAASGQDVGGMFKTEPTSSEYQLYQQAKKEREAKEAEKAAKAAQAKAKAEAASPK